jgi:hypothetical protein
MKGDPVFTTTQPSLNRKGTLEMVLDCEWGAFPSDSL